MSNNSDDGKKVWQEFYCNDCDGWISIKLNVSINHSVQIVCPGPGCTRKHPRKIENGKIITGGGTYGEEIYPPPSAYSKTPRAKGAFRGSRDGIVLEEDKRDPMADALIKKRAMELWGGKK